jgi:TRAP-type C4-dicarboxylate transport system permease small subunit
MQNAASLPGRDVKQNPILNVLEKASYWSSLWFERIAMLAIVGIIVATVIDVIGAKVFHSPLSAGTEIVYFLQIIAIAGGLAFAQIDNRHVRLEFVDSFPHIIKSVFNLLSSAAGLGLFIILSWKSYDYALDLRTANEVTAASRIALYPFVFWIALCCLPMCLVLLKGMVNSIIGMVKK